MGCRVRENLTNHRGSATQVTKDVKTPTDSRCHRTIGEHSRSRQVAAEIGLVRTDSDRSMRPFSELPCGRILERRNTVREKASETAVLAIPPEPPAEPWSLA